MNSIMNESSTIKRDKRDKRDYECLSALAKRMGLFRYNSPVFVNHKS